VLAPLGRSEEAVREARRALTLDPLSHQTSYIAQQTMLLSGLYQDTEREARRAIQFEPRASYLYGWLSLALSFQGKHVEAMETIQMGKRLGIRGGADSTLACVAVRAGHRDEAERMLRETQNAPPDAPGPRSRRLFIIFTCLGDRDHALEYAEKMY